MTHLDIPVAEWFTFEQMYLDAVQRASPGAVFVEVGVFLGRSAAFMANAIKVSGKPIKFYGVDSWDGFTGHPNDVQAQRLVLGPNPPDLFKTFLANMHACGVADAIKPIRMRTPAAAARFADHSIEFCFMDASHDYGSMIVDIPAWLAKMKPGGIMAGHDFRNGHHEVDRAVIETFGKAVIADTQQQTWMVRT